MSGFDIVPRNLGREFDLARTIHKRVRLDLGERVGISQSFGASTSKQKEKESSMDYGACTLTRSRFKTGKRKRRSARGVFNSLVGQGATRIIRWQQVSPNILGAGRVCLGWSTASAGDVFERTPIHWMSLTQHNLGQSNVAKGCGTNGMHRVTFFKDSGNFAQDAIAAQDSLGDTPGSAAWRDEYRDYSPGQVSGRVYHSWTDIKLVLYGTLTVPITYNVFLVTLPENLDPQYTTTFLSPGSEINTMYRDMMRKLCGNVIAQNGNVTWPKDVRIVRKHSVTLQPLSYSDQKAENELTGNFAQTAGVHKLNWFIRHDRFRDYKWSKNSDQMVYDNNLQTCGWDVNSPLVAMTDCEWGKKLYLFITASSPTVEVGTAANTDFTDNNPAWMVRQGSYDICVRNKHVYHG